jgi:hypothetical protein
VEAASSPLLLGSVEMNGQSHESILQLVPEVMDGKGMMQFMRQCRLLRAPRRLRNQAQKPLSGSEANKQSTQARRVWEGILTNLDAGEKNLSYIERPEDLKRYLDALVNVGDKIRAALKRPGKTVR